MKLTFVLFSLAFAQVPAQQRMVVVISLDGFPAYALDDPKLPIPTLRRLMTTVNPTVTWPNHTAIVTGVRADEQGLLANGTIVPTGGWPPVKVEPMIDKQKMVAGGYGVRSGHKSAGSRILTSRPRLRDCWAFHCPVRKGNRFRFSDS